VGARLASLLILLGAAAPSAAGVYTWVDEQGVTHIADDPALLPEGARGALREGRDGLRDLWEEGLRGEPPTRAPRPASVADERVERLVRGAVEDLERGETARASVALNGVLRLDPRSPEAHWYLALLDRQRGRYDSAEAHLQILLAVAGPEYEVWRRAAERKLAALADERRLADAASLPNEERWLRVAHPHFRVRYDAALGQASPDYAATVLRFLEEAHADAAQRLGALPAEPLGVVLYGKAAYLRAHRHRFSFQTVGFFDGRIHVVSAAHPAGELRALLFHEYTHAVFRERSGGDRPFWLNEGLAELAERAARRQPGLSRSERSLLRRRIDAGAWISLERLAPSFAGLSDEDARVAYLIGTAAAAWLAERSGPRERGALLARLAEGASDDEALGAVLGMATHEIDAALRAWLRDEFPSPPPSGERAAAGHAQ
jgi:hypothetical protein